MAVRRSWVARMVAALVLGASLQACTSGGEESPGFELGERKSAFRDIGKRSASELN